MNDGFQANTSSTLFEPVLAIFGKLDTLAHPDELLEALKTMGVVWAVIFFAAGIVCMLHGYRFYRSVTVILAMLLGLFAGYALSSHLQAPAYIVAGCMALLTAVLCLPLMKYAVAVMGGLTGAFIGANLWTAVVHVMHQGNPEAAATGSRYAGVGALLGLLICGMLAFILFKLSVVLFTSVSGSTVAVLGGLALLLQIPGVRDSVFEAIKGQPVVIPLLVLVPAAIGLILQEAQPDTTRTKPEGKTAPA